MGFWGPRVSGPCAMVTAVGLLVRGSWLRMPHKNAGPPVTFESQINNRCFFLVDIDPQYCTERILRDVCGLLEVQIRMGVLCFGLLHLSAFLGGAVVDETLLGSAGGDRS